MPYVTRKGGLYIITPRPFVETGLNGLRRATMGAPGLGQLPFLDDLDVLMKGAKALGDGVKQIGDAIMGKGGTPAQAKQSQGTEVRKRIRSWYQQATSYQERASVGVRKGLASAVNFYRLSKAIELSMAHYMEQGPVKDTLNYMKDGTEMYSLYRQVVAGNDVLSALFQGGQAIPVTPANAGIVADGEGSGLLFGDGVSTTAATVGVLAVLAAAFLL